MPMIIGGSSNSILTTTWANKPASYPVGQSVFMSNVGPKGSHWWFDGTRWKPTNGSVVLATLDSVSANIANTRTIVFQYLIPAGMWQSGDVLRLQLMIEKSGTTDAGEFTIFIGTAGTTADTIIINGTTWLATANRTGQFFADVRLESATSVQQISGNLGYSTLTTALSPVTISSASANALYVSAGLKSSGATDTVDARAAMLQLFSKAN